jgi:hypothetical protein
MQCAILEVLNEVPKTLSERLIVLDVHIKALTTVWNETVTRRHKLAAHAGKPVTKKTNSLFAEVERNIRMQSYRPTRNDDAEVVEQHPHAGNDKRNFPGRRMYLVTQNHQVMHFEREFDVKIVCGIVVLGDNHVHLVHL